MMADWLLQNREWVFSGIGIAILGGVWTVIKTILKRKNLAKSNVILKQQNTNGSKGTQIGIQNNYGREKNE
jgi:hypothetical protein